MTQEQKTKIREHFDELHAIVSDYGLNVPNDISDALRAAYLAGADYALDIYSPHWISIKEELPPKEGRYIFYDEILGPQVSIYFEGCTLDSSITHWMHKPQAPTCSEKPNNSKKGGEG